MKRTPMSLSRSLGNRKLIFAMVKRGRRNVTETLLNRYVIVDATVMRTHIDRIPETTKGKK